MLSSGNDSLILNSLNKSNTVDANSSIDNSNVLASLNDSYGGSGNGIGNYGKDDDSLFKKED